MEKSLSVVPRFSDSNFDGFQQIYLQALAMYTAPLCGYTARPVAAVCDF